MQRLLVVFAIVVLGFAAVGSAAPTGSTDLKITKTATAPSVAVGSTLGYTIVVEDLGPDAATGVIATDSLPKGVDFGSVSSTVGQCALQGRKVSCSIGNLAAEASGTKSATITLNVVPRKSGPITNTATVKGDQKDPVGSNDQASVTTQVIGAAPAPTCRGVSATIVGTAGPDSLTGTGGRDVILALAGDDAIVSLAGRDLVCAGSGNDRVVAGSAGDRVFGGADRDRLLGRGAADALRGGSGNDVLKGNAGPDDLRGGRGVDTCRGGAGADTIRGCER
jgi:uncharacterized repeat protein (TIGR01451 family)